ncbi:MAG: hypothetical protein FRX49_03556 [Trebouxia sp. A1-2]|nr:MAG: hypothetical protein FRX49_03556 [Trebouxia sp. A1-2]
MIPTGKPRLENSTKTKPLLCSPLAFCPGLARSRASHASSQASAEVTSFAEKKGTDAREGWSLSLAFSPSKSIHTCHKSSVGGEVKEVLLKSIFSNQGRKPSSADAVAGGVV